MVRVFIWKKITQKTAGISNVIYRISHKLSPAKRREEEDLLDKRERERERDERDGVVSHLNHSSGRWLRLRQRQRLRLWLASVDFSLKLPRGATTQCQYQRKHEHEHEEREDFFYPHARGLLLAMLLYRQGRKQKQHEYREPSQCPATSRAREEGKNCR